MFALVVAGVDGNLGEGGTLLVWLKRFSGNGVGMFAWFRFSIHECFVLKGLVRDERRAFKIFGYGKKAV